MNSWFQQLKFISMLTSSIGNGDSNLKFHHHQMLKENPNSLTIIKNKFQLIQKFFNAYQSFLELSICQISINPNTLLLLPPSSLYFPSSRLFTSFLLFPHLPSLHVLSLSMSIILELPRSSTAKPVAMPAKASPTARSARPCRSHGVSSRRTP